MKSLLYAITASILLTSCNLTNDKNEDLKSIRFIPSGRFSSGASIDYKLDEYNFYLGQSKDSIEKFVDLRHNYLVDDGIVNEYGITHYTYTGEQLVKVNGADCLPALFFTTDNLRLTGFECSIIFPPDSFDTKELQNCVFDMKNLFKRLHSRKNRNTLARNLKLSLSSQGYYEVFTLDTTDRKYEVLFSYEKRRITTASESAQSMKTE